MAHRLYDYWTDELIGAATADHVALSDATLTWGGDGMIHIDAAGRVCAFGDHVVPGPELRCVFTQPDADSAVQANDTRGGRPRRADA